MIEIAAYTIGLMTGIITLGLLILIVAIELIRILSDGIKVIVDKDILEFIYIAIMFSFFICIISSAIYFLTSLSFV